MVNNFSRILCTICARGGSKGVANKNIKPLLGKPLIAYTIEQAQQTGLFEHIIVSTDSDEIARTAQEYGAEVFFKRPAELSTDNAPKIPVIRHAFCESEKHFQKTFDALIDLDATSPLRNAADIQEAFNLFSSGHYDNLITAMPSRRSPYFNLIEQTADGKVTLSKPPTHTIVRRQDAPACYDMNASIYIWTRDALLTHDTVFLQNTGLYVMPEERSIDIDSELDFKFVEFLMGEKHD